MSRRAAPLGLATCSTFPDLQPDERPLLSWLGDRGLPAEPVVWDDRGVDWRRYRAVIVRSTWDYHLKHEGFLRWIARLEEAGVPLLNPGPVLRWSLDKRYLLDLERAGVAIVPTEWVPAGEARSLAAIASARRWRRIVVKPAISASAHGAWAAELPCSESEAIRFREQVAASDLLVQPFLNAVCRDGEWSLMFFDGRYSHAVVKRPCPGEFRVQSAHGGRWEAANPTAAIVAVGGSVLEAMPFAPSKCLYARVDGIVDRGRFRLMELELVEPALFLEGAPDGCQRFADAIARRVHGLGS